ncbi:hypothetical protein QQO16_01845 [Limosilactobacillus reuteri]|uniref:hypothetical protein n=1 Tax=Limosilactobacillus reuteri TaxID=1598 RepID=UPI002551E06A|nr:hypothetical protein [Limosilactobacillus reuteri]MDL2056795.1 hypothetical protein [Limosilactobacillus reuteri]
MKNRQKEKATIKAASLETEISKLKSENTFLKQLLKDNPVSLKIERVIHITERIGSGKSDDPVREVHKLWTNDGKFIAILEEYPI